MLKILESVIQDERIKIDEVHDYEPITGTNPNNTGEIRINIESQNIFTQPSESCPMVEGILIKTADGTVYTDDADAIALVNNAIMYLFRSIRYELSGQEIESVNHPGQATTMFCMLKYSDDFQKGQGLDQCWYKDTGTAAVIANNLGFAARQKYIVQLPNPEGTFRFKIPLKQTLKFSEDYDEVVYGFRHTLTITRDANDNAIVRHAGADAGKIALSKLSWMMPHITLAVAEKFKLYKTIENKSQLEVGFRMRQCDTIAVLETTNFTWILGVKSVT